MHLIISISQNWCCSCRECFSVSIFPLRRTTQKKITKRDRRTIVDVTWWSTSEAMSSKRLRAREKTFFFLLGILIRLALSLRIMIEVSLRYFLLLWFFDNLEEENVEINWIIHLYIYLRLILTGCFLRRRKIIFARTMMDEMIIHRLMTIRQSKSLLYKLLTIYEMVDFSSNKSHSMAITVNSQCFQVTYSQKWNSFIKGEISFFFVC